LAPARPKSTQGSRDFPRLAPYVQRGTLKGTRAPAFFNALPMQPAGSDGLGLGAGLSICRSVRIGV